MDDETYKGKFIIVVSSTVDLSRAPLPRILDFCSAINLTTSSFSSMVIGHIPWVINSTIATEGNYHGVDYWYTCKPVQRPSIKPLRGILKIYASLRVLSYLFKNRRNICVVHTHFGENFFRTFWYWICCKVTNINLSCEFAEYPFILKKSKSYIRQFDYSLRDRMCHYLYKKYAYNYFDGYISITTYLNDWINNRTAGKCITARIPISINIEEFGKHPVPLNSSLNKLGYVGVLKYSDELDVMVNMFEIVRQKIPHAELVIIGDFSGGEKEKIRNRQNFKHKLRDRNLLNSVNMLGVIEHSKIPDILCECGILILPRPFTLISKAGFPSKLAEYLALEKPVVVTATGDIPLYLHDGVSAYLVYSDSPAEFADKVLQAIENPDEARRIARNGRKVAEESFSLPVIGEMLCKYINDLNTN